MTALCIRKACYEAKIFGYVKGKHDLFFKCLFLSFIHLWYPLGIKGIFLKIWCVFTLGVSPIALGF
jgi:hypothetical protein